MVIDNLILHDFGVYGGYQEIKLTPKSSDKPVVLFGGLNGAGKTTLLDALQLCLFGQVARCSNRNGKSYDDYLAACINKHARYKESLVGMDFRHTTNGKESEYRVRRSWRTKGGGIKENFTVHIDKLPAKVIADNWLQHIDEIMPANIAHLFFFDGEQAEDYVASDKASALIETAILNLLGLDVVNQLDKDLKTFEKRKAVKSLEKGKQAEVKAHEVEITGIKNEIDRMDQKCAWIRSYEIEPKKKQLQELDERFKKIGGELYQRRDELEQKSKLLETELAQQEDALRKTAEGCLPLLLVKGQLASLVERDKREREVANAQVVKDTLEKVSEELLGQLKKTKVDKVALDLVDKYLAKKQMLASKSTSGSVKNPLDEHTRYAIHTLGYDKIQLAFEESKILVSSFHELKQKAEDAALEWASVPKSNDIESIHKELGSAESSLVESQKELEGFLEQQQSLQKLFLSREDSLKKLITEEAERQIEDEEKQRLLTHSEKARQTLDVFKHEVINRHITHIQALVLENYQRLLHKKALINRVSINPETFKVKLFDKDSIELPVDRLSAGERQLLAISLLWGMAKASGRPLPTAIDTPLGRLDAAHRQFLVQRYFPHASHQVLLFSTDQEVSGQYFDELRNRVGRMYRLVHNDKTSTTEVMEGYLQ